LKKILSFIIVSAMIFIFHNSLCAEEEIMAGSFTSLKGEVTIQHAEAEDWEEAEIDMPVFPGEKIKTGEKSEAELMLDDGSMLRIEEKTTIEIIASEIDNNNSGKKKNFLMKLGIGKILNNFKKAEGSGSKYGITTGSAVIGVRGTEFSVECIDEKTDVEVYEGEVEVSGLPSGLPDGTSAQPEVLVQEGSAEQKPVLVSRDFQISVEKGARPLTPQAIGEKGKLYRENVVLRFNKRVETNRMRINEIRDRRNKKIENMKKRAGNFNKKSREKIEKNKLPRQNNPEPGNVLPAQNKPPTNKAR